MTLNELRYIVTLAQEQHFGRAAERCFVSQPTLSIAVKKLETELGVALFERSKTRVQATPLGERIVSQAQLVLEQAAAIKDIASAGKDQLASPLSVGAIFTIGPYLFPHFIPQLQKLAPDMPLYVEEGYTATLRQQLRKGELDAIIIALPFTEPDVVTQPLYDEPFVVLMPANHPLAAQEFITPEQLSQDNVLLLGEGHCFRDQVLEACPQLQQTMEREGNGHIRTAADGSSLETLRHMVASGLGITVLPLSAATASQYANGLLETRPFAPPAPQRTVALAWRASFPRHQAIDKLREAINQCQLRDQ
ncbi:hydrogen peroxide-inducible genes activator [Microbulbifer thermotolerans]|uniref:Hydrogen peroxide-inducible genes activator n=1 Tax=Microbulbifer thermotolerans TaxID=252514 RepID=A0A143HQB8_MICTH|nr:hydrogen peroxide-inducible genes activator [Microbulbifer thermotolerans]AMX03878.1 LysR family transcriptional regulator [Microbulbifer thermotolerans]MCX2778607.1 hydrogen peroxide-inducible genes activator [Microbulbifer thermotolerans]MCX2782847.1 hydrogen peroxide-inducible genes activator [Microbulbifer thermotolerans]MCX2794083.1 hydrogen peroxide-inducible genes activator [Microbulbifer thermotolerans]MCX2802978.1 hydrogen peroxide-inducible genes activator [Microbulbifer thermotol